MYCRMTKKLEKNYNTYATNWRINYKCFVIVFHLSKMLLRSKVLYYILLSNPFWIPFFFAIISTHKKGTEKPTTTIRTKTIWICTLFKTKINQWPRWKEKLIQEDNSFNQEAECDKAWKQELNVCTINKGNHCEYCCAGSDSIA